MENTALLIIDVQNDYFSNGALTLNEADETATKINKLLNLFREKRLPIVHIQHETTKLEMGFMLPDSFGQKIHDSVKPLNNEACFTKHYPNSFWETELEAYLRKIDVGHLVIVGMMTHMCVSTTARAAMERGLQATLIQNACTTRSLEFDGIAIPWETVHKTALAELAMFSKITSLNSFLIEQFPAIS